MKLRSRRRSIRTRRRSVTGEPSRAGAAIGAAIGAAGGEPVAGEGSPVSGVGNSVALHSLPDQPRPPLVHRSPFSFGFLVTLGGLLALGVVLALGQVTSIILYIVTALFIALGLDPIVRRLERRRVNRAGAIAIVFGTFLLLVSALLAVLTPVVVQQVQEFVKVAPGSLQRLAEQDWMISLNEQLGGAIDLTRAAEQVGAFLTDPAHLTMLAGGLVQAGVGIANGLTGAMIVLILSLYFLASLPAMKQGLYSLAPRSARVTTTSITEQITQSIGGYVNGMVLLAFLNAALGWAAMSLIGVPFAGILALVVFFLAMIPLIGSVLAAGVVTFVALFDGPSTALWIGLYYLIYLQIEAYLFTPKVMNKVVSVPGSLVVIGALAGGTLLGLLGALIAIPVTAALLMIVQQVLVPAQEKR